MATERFESPLERIQSIEEGDIEPIRRMDSGFLGYDYYLIRERRLRAEVISRIMQRVWRAVGVSWDILKTHTRLKSDRSEKPASIKGM